MKKLLLALAVMLPITQEAAAYSSGGLEYTWSCFDTCADAAYINQFQITISWDATGVTYHTAMVSDSLPGNSALTALGIYEDDPLGNYLTTPGVVTNSAGTSFTYQDTYASLPSGNNAAIIFGAEATPQGINGAIDEITDWTEVKFAYAAGQDATSFINNALFSPNHYIYVHLQGLIDGSGQEVSDGSDKWKLTWTGDPCVVNPDSPDCSGGDRPPLPEPGVLALLGIGLLGMGLSHSHRKNSN